MNLSTTEIIKYTEKFVSVNNKSVTKHENINKLENNLSK